MSEADLVKRLERLERDNRQLKRVALVALVLLGAAVGLGAAYAKPAVPQKVVAHELDVVDRAGKVRVKVAMDCSIANDCWPAVSLLDANGKPLTMIGAGTLTVSGEAGETVILDNNIQIAGMANGKWTGAMADLGAGFMSTGGALTLSDTGGSDVFLRSNQGGTLNLTGKDRNSVYLSATSPSVEIADSKGYFMDLGVANTVTPATGHTQQTSADSIVMFGNGKKHHVIWEAPR